MYLERPSTILKLLNNLRWTDKFICLKCGNTKSIKGDDIYDKKCSKCKKNVSLTKYTAFEGLRFPIEKAYGILETLIERAELDSEAKVIKEYKRNHSGRQGYDLVDDPEEYRNSENISDEYEYVSLIDIINRSNKRGLRKERLMNTMEGANSDKIQIKQPTAAEIKKDEERKERLNKLLEEINNRWRPSISMLAKKFDVEENTVSKFIEKVDRRIRDVYVGKHPDPLDSVLSFIKEYNYHQSFNKKITVLYFLGLAMVPMVGDWRYGLFRANGKFYGVELVEDEDGKSNGEWSVYRITGSRDEHRYTFELHERIEYGTQEWYDLFHVNIDN